MAHRTAQVLLCRRLRATKAQFRWCVVAAAAVASNSSVISEKAPLSWKHPPSAMHFRRWRDTYDERNLGSQPPLTSLWQMSDVCWPDVFIGTSQKWATASQQTDRANPIHSENRKRTNRHAIKEVGHVQIGLRLSGYKDIVEGLL